MRRPTSRRALRAGRSLRRIASPTPIRRRCRGGPTPFRIRRDRALSSTGRAPTFRRCRRTCRACECRVCLCAAACARSRSRARRPRRLRERSPPSGRFRRWSARRRCCSARPSRRRAPRRAAPASPMSIGARLLRARRDTAGSSPTASRCLRRAPVPGMSSTPSISSIRKSCVSGPHRREADAAVAHDDRRHAVPAGRRQDRIPGRLTVVVRVHVDPARRDDQPFASISCASPFR